MIRFLPNVWLGMLLSIGRALHFAGYFRVISRLEDALVITIPAEEFQPNRAQAPLIH